MTAVDLAAAIQALQRAETLAVRRFDSERPLKGRVAVLPSAFNPPTDAHLELLRRAVQLGGHAVPAALLTTRNVDKGIYGASLDHRAAMLLALRQEEPSLAVLVSNAARIADQARSLRKASPLAELDFVVGFDTLVRLFDPRYYDDMATELPLFFEHHRLLAANRGDAGSKTLDEFLARGMVRDFAGRIGVIELEADTASLSSTAARKALARGELPPGVPAAVVRYIHEHALYGAR